MGLLRGLGSNYCDSFWLKRKSVFKWFFEGTIRKYCAAPLLVTGTGVVSVGRLPEGVPVGRELLHRIYHGSLFAFESSLSSTLVVHRLK